MLIFAIIHVGCATNIRPEVKLTSRCGSGLTCFGRFPKIPEKKLKKKIFAY